MYKKNFKKLAVLTLSMAMVASSMITVFAEGEDETAAPTSQTATGTGKYEGKDGKLPMLQITLPTTFGEGVDYIADPNNLIGTVANNGSLGSAVTVDTNAGILFKSDTNKYAGTSKKMEIENANYQDIDITVKLEQKTAGDASIVYTDSATFDDTDTENKLYLALTTDETTPTTAALSAGKAAVLTTKIEGKKGNYTLKYDNNEYVYGLNDGATGWNKCGFSLTGAINKKATWNEGVTFPEIQVTWSYKEHKDAYVDNTSVSTSSKTLNLTMPEGTTISKVELTLNGGNPITLSNGNQYTVRGTVLTFGSYASSWSGGTITITYSDNHTDEIACQ